MAGLGRKEFNSGDILLASEVQGYLQDQAVMVFDDAAARGSAIPSPSEGMLTYNKDTDQLELYDGAAFGPVGSDAGLVHIETQTFSAVSGVEFDGVFTSEFDNYRVIASITGGDATERNLQVRLRVGGSGITDGNYANFTSLVRYSNGSVSTTFATSQTSFTRIGSLLSSKPNAPYNFDINNPNLNTDTHLTGFSREQVTGANAGAFFHAIYDGSTKVADGFSFSTTGTFTGTATVYGYRK